MMMGYGYVGMLLFWGLFLALLAGGAVLVVWMVARARQSGGPPSTAARQVLDERLARGEISGEEYDALRAKIER